MMDGIVRVVVLGFPLGLLNSVRGGLENMKRIHYCKSLKKTGKPIIVKDMDTGEEISTDSIEMKNVTIRMSFNNAIGREKGRGATTVLEVYENVQT